MSIRLRVVLLAFSILWVADVRAQGALVRSYVDVDSIVVGQRFTLVVVAEHDEETSPSFSRILPDSLHPVRQFGDLLILREVDRGRVGRAEGVVHDSTVVEATAFAIDTAVVAPMPVTFLRGSDSTIAFTDAFLIPVRSVLDADASDIRDLAPIAEFRSPVLAWVLFLAALIATMGAFIFWYRRRPRQVLLHQDHEVARLEPADEAHLRLRRLGAHRVDSDEDAEAFCVELADILRTYLSRRTPVHALEMTTSEVRTSLDQLALENVVPTETPQDTARVLEVCDLAKFAELFPDQTTCSRELESTERIVDRIEDHLRPSELAPVEDSSDDAPDLQHA